MFKSKVFSLGMLAILLAFCMSFSTACSGNGNVWYRFINESTHVVTVYIEGSSFNINPQNSRVYTTQVSTDDASEVPWSYQPSLLVTYDKRGREVVFRNMSKKLQEPSSQDEDKVILPSEVALDCFGVVLDGTLDSE